MGHCSYKYLEEESTDADCQMHMATQRSWMPQQAEATDHTQGRDNASPDNPPLQKNLNSAMALS